MISSPLGISMTFLLFFSRRRKNNAPRSISMRTTRTPRTIPAITPADIPESESDALVGVGEFVGDGLPVAAASLISEGL